MHRVVAIALSMVFGSYGLVLLKSTVLSFVNLTLDSFNFWFAKRKSRLWIPDMRLLLNFLTEQYG